RLLGALARAAQGAARRLLAPRGAPPAQHLAQLLHARPARRVGRLSHLRAMRICLVTPAPSGSRKGNRVTALRWAKRLRELGHRVRLREELAGGAWDVIIALHARKSAPSVAWAAAAGIPVIVALTGTDLYDDLPRSPEARRALEQAWRIVTLQPLALHALPVELRAPTPP